MLRWSPVALTLLVLSAGLAVAAAAAEASEEYTRSSPESAPPQRHGHRAGRDGVVGGGGGGGGYDCDVCAACFAKSAEVRAKEQEWSSLFQIKGQVARKAQDDRTVAEKWDVFKGWTWAKTTDELLTDEKTLIGEMERVNDELKAAHHEVRRARQEFPVECEGDASPLTSVRGRRTLTRLDPDVYPDRPDVSFVIQYFKQPLLVKPLVDYYHSCTNGRLGDAAGNSYPPNPNPGITSELIVNVDNPDEATQWLEQQREKGDFLTLLFSPNVHETRGYNRAAGAASGRIVVFLQDDDVPSDGCRDWVKNLVTLFDAHKRLGVVGLKKACYSRWGACTYADRDVKFKDPKTGLGFQFVSVADFAPYAVRKAAFMDVGMFDEGMAPAGESGILTDYEFCERAWGAGWQVGQMALAVKLKGCSGGLKCEGGTLHGISHELREKNQLLNPIPFDRRIRFREHREIFDEVIAANTQLLQPANSDVDVDALWEADRKHHYYAKHSHIPEQLAEEDKETAEVKRSDINVVAPIPKDLPMTVSKNMRARGGGNKQRGGGGAGGAGLGRRGGVADDGGDEMGDGVDVADDDKDDGAAVKDKDDAAKKKDDDKTGKVRDENDDGSPKPASGASLREQEMAYWKKHDGNSTQG